MRVRNILILAVIAYILWKYNRIILQKIFTMTGVNIKDHLPLGVRNNNPLNLRHYVANKWQGQTNFETAKEGEFCQFDTMENGIRAAKIVLANYIKNGHDTIREIITRFAPSNENDTAAYMKYVSDQMTEKMQEDINIDTCIDPLYVPLLAYVMSGMEVGEKNRPELLVFGGSYPLLG